jgi:adenylate kinase
MAANYRILILGPPGAGKGTQSVVLTNKFKLLHISTGELLREAVAKGSEIGKEAKSYLDSGKLVPDTVVLGLVKDKISSSDSKTNSQKGGFLLDGFPRNIAQATALDQVLADISSPITHVVELSVPEIILLDRIRSRVKSGATRSDDNEKVLAKRLQIYWSETAPLSSYYREKNILCVVDGLGTVEEVTARIMKIFS